MKWSHDLRKGRKSSPIHVAVAIINVVSMNTSGRRISTRHVNQFPAEKCTVFLIDLRSLPDVAEDIRLQTFVKTTIYRTFLYEDCFSFTVLFRYKYLMFSQYL